MSERFLVTGAYGCIGAWIIRQLLREGVEVIGMDASADDRRVRQLVEPEQLSELSFLRADLSDPSSVSQLLAHEPTHIIHLAALQVPACAQNPVLGAQVNVVGTVALFAAASAAGLPTPIVYASSVAAFAAADGAEEPPANPTGSPDTHYGVFKVANEGAARIFALQGSLSSIGLRPYIVYGAGRDQGLTSAVTSAIGAAASGQEYEIPFGGRCELQFGPDVAAAFIAASRCGFTGATVLNVPGTTLAVSEIVSEIERVLPDAAGKLSFEGPQLPFPDTVDSSGFTTTVGDLSVTPFGEGVALTAQHFQRFSR